jgi:hypothetical protein
MLKLFEKGQGETKKSNRGRNLTKVHNTHVWKHHNETPLYN